MVAEEEKRAAMKIVASRARDDVDSPARADSCREVEVGRRKLELLDHFLRKVLLGAAGDGILNCGAVHRDPYRVARGASAQDRHVKLFVVLAHVVRRHGYTWFEHGELQKIAAVQRQVLNPLTCNDARDRVAVIIDLRRLALYTDDFACRPEIHGQVRSRDLAGLHGCILHECAETVSDGFDAVTAGGQGSGAVDALVRRHNLPRQTGIFISHGDSDPLHDSARRVTNCAHNRTNRRLRRADDCSASRQNKNRRTTPEASGQASSESGSFSHLAFSEVSDNSISRPASDGVYNPVELL